MTPSSPPARVWAVIAEKPSVAAAIARSLLPPGLSLETVTWRDEFVHVGEADAEAGTDDGGYYWQRDNSLSRVKEVLAETRKGRAKRRSILPEGNDLDRSAREVVTYYVIPLVGMSADYALIADTQGNPLRQQNLSDNHDTLDPILRASRWAEYAEHFRLAPQSSGQSARLAWFRHVLGEKSFPCAGSRFQRDEQFDLQQVYAATDYDTAGQYISYSVYTFCQTGGSTGPQAGARPLVRLDMNDLTPQALRYSFEHPVPFHWGMAFGGEVRAQTDFLVGVFSGPVLGRAWRRVWNDHRLPEQYERLPFGRVQTTALAALCTQHESLDARPRRFLYLIFDGLISWSDLEKDFRQGSFAWVQTVETLRAVSHARFLQACQDAKVGTHTTRFGQLRQLVDRHLATGDERTVSPSPFGSQYRRWLSRVFGQTILNMDALNERLHETLTATKECSDADQARILCATFIETFYLAFRRFLMAITHPDGRAILSAALGDLAISLATLQTMEQTRPAEPSDGALERSDPVREGAIHIHGLDQSITTEMAESLSTENAGVEKIVRTIPVPVYDYQAKIRRICAMDAGKSIQYVGWGSIDRLLPESDFSVFKASFEYDLTAEWLEQFVPYAGLRLDLPLEVNSELEAAQGQATGADAHPPLHLNGIKRSMIKGPTGLLLAKEYQAPWQATLAKRRAAKAGAVLPGEFMVTGRRPETALSRSHVNFIHLALGNSTPPLTHTSDLQFSRVERYRTGRVHNFEGVLAAMSQYFGVSFEKTATMMQEMYVST